MQLTQRRVASISTSRVLTGALLVLLFVAAALLRFNNINWDQFQHLHPDERWIVWVADTMRWPNGAGLNVVLDPQVSPFNPFRWPPTAGDLAGQPRNYAYGHFPLYLLVGVAHLAAQVGQWFGETTIAFPAWVQPFHTVGRHLADYSHLALVGRAISALADLGTLLIVYAMSSRVASALRPPLGRLAGLLATAFYTFAVLPIQLSHFAAVDALLTFFVVATVALAARYAEQGGRWTWALAGIMAGLAVGSKFSAVMLALPLLAATLFRLPQAGLKAGAIVVLRRAIPVSFIAFLTFAITNPFALLELGQYAYRIAEQNLMVSGAMDAPYTRQYIGTLPYWYFVQQFSQWGIGWPAGLAAWAGVVWAMARFGLGKASAALTVLLAWAVPYFVATGLFHAKFLRYMAPLLPFLLVFGATFAVSGYCWLSERWGRRGQAAWSTVAFVAGAVTVLWAIAFSSVYQQEHPWLAASRWIFRNIPEGSKILSEEWDDALPLAMDELTDRPPLRQYERVELPMWDADSNGKIEKISRELASADYLTISSNRIYAPIARLAGRYPMTAQYYRQLFAGELGYRLIADFSAYPRIGNWIIRDDNADESLSVYDHPHAFVFENSERLTADQLTLRLKRGQPQPGGRQAASGRAPGLGSVQGQEAGPLRLGRPVSSLPDVTDYRWNARASASPVLATVLWWFVITVFGWFAWPLMFPLARGLADRGHAASRVFGWLLLGWLHWIGVSLGLWLNALGPLLLILLVLTVIGRAGWAAQRRAMAVFWRQRRRLILGQEVLFAVAFLVFVFIRVLNPDLWQPWNGGEKFMEFAFLNATLRSPVFPPYDPYFAGGTINYYYFGLYLVGLPIRLTGIFAEVAFNLAVPSLFALTAVGVFSLAYSIAENARGRSAGGEFAGELGGQVRLARPQPPRPVVVAALAVVLTLLAGNLTGLEWAFGAQSSVIAGKGLPAFDYWAASRVIPFTINEFPLWTFTFADLHPHLISMPFGLLVAALSLSWLAAPAASMIRRWFHLVILAFALGALGAINTWDLPTYALLVVGALLASAWRMRQAIAGRVTAIAVALVSISGVLAVAISLYLPFYLNYQAQVGGGEGGPIGRFLGVVKEASPFRPWLQIWGLFLFLGLSYTLVELLGRRITSEVGSQPVGAHDDHIESAESRRGGRGWLFGVLILVAALAVLAAAGWPTAALAALPLTLALPLFIDRRASEGQVFVALLLVLGLSVIAGIELVYLRDFLEGGEWHRMNTLFKFSVPAWIFLGVASGFVLARLWSLTGRAPIWLGLPWQVAAALLLSGSLIFLLFGVRERVLDRFPGARPALGTLDGMAYMTVGEYAWPGAENPIRLAGDYEAIKWMLTNVSETPVIAEAPAGAYTLNGEAVAFDYYRAGGLRVATMTGLPTFVGQHQYEQRPSDDVARQTFEGMEFFRTTDLGRVRQIIDEFEIGYIYVGQLERVLFAPDSLRKFDTMVEAGELRIAFRNSAAVIYEVVAR